MFMNLIFVGNLGDEPSMRYTPDGTPVTNFSVAVNRKWNNSDGSQGEETIWIRCTAWRKTAEVVNQYLTKGRQVLVEGRLRPDPDTGGPRVFTRNDGSPGASYEVTVEQVKFLGSASNGSNGSSQEAAPVSFEDDTIPF